MARLSPATYSGWYSLWSFSELKPSRIASSVIDDIQRRFTGHFACAFCITQRCISSPSWPASPQLTMQSAACMRRSITLNWRLMPSSSMSFMPKRGGIIGNAERLQCFQCSV